MARAKAIVTLTPRRLKAASRWLAQRDSALKRVLDEHGYPEMWARQPGFSTTVHIILEQQVSLVSANATFYRLEAKLGQMQSGTTGINTIRIYSPAKQAIDHDPKGVFIRKYVPELAQVPDKYLTEPHRMPMDVQSQVGCILGRDYPLPIVDHRKAYKSAQEKIYAIRQTASAIEESKRVFTKHGSRKKRDPLPKPKKASGFRQLSLFDDTDDPSQC